MPDAFRMLSEQDVETIDRAARRLLEEVGIRVRDEGFRDRLEKAGAETDAAAQIVRFPAGWLDQTLSQAPSAFTLHARDGADDVSLGSGRVAFGNGGRVFRILDRDGTYRGTTLADVARTAALVDRLERLRFYIVACHPENVPAEDEVLNGFHQALLFTSKHVMGGCDSLASLEKIRALAVLLAGSEEAFRKAPFLSIITNPISPLTLDPETLKMLQYCGTHGIPATCAPAPIAGATAPATLGGTLSQLHAEALAGVAVTQALVPGAKVLYGAVATAMDLRKMDFTLGSVEGAMMNAAAVQLARRYGLPIYASAGLTEAKEANFQAGFEKAVSSLMVGMAGADFIHLAAGMLDSGNTISLEQYVIDDECLGMVHRVLDGIGTDDDALGVDVVKQVGPGGNFVMEDHTIDHMMEEFFYPDLMVRSNFDVWDQGGRPTTLSRARDKLDDILPGTPAAKIEPAQRDEIRKRFPRLLDVTW